MFDVQNNELNRTKPLYDKPLLFSTRRAVLIRAGQRQEVLSGTDNCP